MGVFPFGIDINAPVKREKLLSVAYKAHDEDSTFIAPLGYVPCSCIQP